MADLSSLILPRQSQASGDYRGTKELGRRREVRRVMMQLPRKTWTALSDIMLSVTSITCHGECVYI
jgi:hypothetical protein